MHVLGMVGELDVLSRMETLPQLLVFGDSIMFSLNELKEIWYPFQKRYNAVNLAVKGERVHSLLHRVRFSDWDLLYEGKEGLKVDNRVPLVVIIMIGTNDIGKGESFLTVAASIDMIVKECILKIPRISHIFVFSVLPRALESYNMSINNLNRKISELYAHSKLLNGSITFVDLTPLFRAKDFSIKKNMYLADR
jgi:lysophospholipase L1-like esterase